MNTPKDFQRYTAKRIVELFTRKGQYRVLLADEVGLGKTTVAAKVISQIAAWHRAKKDDEFNVVYVCSNLSIAQQNMRSLGFDEKDTLRLGESRLSMQHLKIAERRLENDAKKQKMRWNSIPLTPSTSFSMTAGYGTVQERALIQLLIKQYLKRNFPERRLPCMGWMAFGVKKENWKVWTSHFDKRLKDLSAKGSGYVEQICAILSERLKEYHMCIENLYTIAGNSFDSEKDVADDQRAIMRNLRKIFAQTSISMLKPDLVVMDEFQRFSDLIATSEEGERESEVATLFRHFINCENELHTKVLLLSATPYKPYSTIDDLADGKDEDHYTGFFKVMDFLHGNEERQEAFRNTWHEYSEVLSTLTSGKDTIVRVKEEAQTALYHVMCRTERHGAGFKESVIPDYKASGKIYPEYPTSEYLAYAEMEHLIGWAKSQGASLSFSHVPVDYVKSSPYLMSYMQDYRLKKDIDGVLKKNRTKETMSPFDFRALYINWHTYKSYKGLPLHNAKLAALKEMLLKDRFQDGCASLLWVPASNPYYKVPMASVFSKQHDFSKVLVFSAWEMVPRMLSTILSYEALCQTMKVLHKNYPNKRIRLGLDGQAKTKLQIPEEQRALLAYPSKLLSTIYMPQEYYGMTIEEVRRNVRRKLLSEITFVEKGMMSYEELLSAIEAIDSGQKTTVKKQHIETLVDMAIGSPGVCLMRLTKDAGKAREAAKTILGIFNPNALRVIDAYYKDDGTRLGKILRYCVEGNLASVLDEYAHMLGGASHLVRTSEERKQNKPCDLEKAIHQSPGPKVDMIKPAKGEKPTIVSETMPVNIAVAFSQNKQDESSANAVTNVREAFNSPFRPFILASTSVGQEGLDFHKYARKIVHWNLPSNPVDLEQREGRINRYECLAIRRNVAKRYADSSHFTWEEIFRHASNELRGDSDMIPYWYLPESFYKDGSPDDYEMIERIVPQYPFSYDQGRYKRLVDVLSLYRLTLGQPKQEELVKLLEERHLTDNEIRALTMDLSPLKRNKAKKEVLD